MQNAKLSFGLVVIGVALLIAPAPVCSSAGLVRQQKKTLTFAERVAYQYEIEEVYWRHRIWPKENPGPKPSLDDVMSRAEIERKIEGYLRESQLLADQLQRPIMSADLQAEMDLIASHTKQSDVLRELFAALNNDPLLIAECLAKPILAERLTTRSAVVAGVSPAQTNSSAADTAASTAKNSVTYSLPQISIPQDCADDTWTPTSLVNAPSGRLGHTAVWTGNEMIVWGGNDGMAFLNTGGIYNPATDSWTATSTTNTPSARSIHTAVWTGSEMIVWGGYDMLNTGGRYNPGTNSWTATNTINAPTGREYHTAVWSGSEMIVWGGDGFSGDFNTGGRYNPATNSWIATNTTSAPSGRQHHSAVWTGSEMIVWGGTNSAYLNTGGRYNPATNSWTATSTSSAPAGREYPTAVWSGSEMIVWGGEGFPMYFNTGGRYNPATNSWIATSTTSAPSGRYLHTAIWTGSEMIVWGGYDGNTDVNTGGRYNPSAANWVGTSATNAPYARESHTAVWTGSEMIVWSGSPILNFGGRYCARPPAPVVQSAVSRKAHGGNPFDITLPGIECRTTGGTNDYTMVLTFSGNVTVTGNPQAQLIAGTGCAGSAGVCTGNVSVSGAVVTVPLTNIINDQNIIVRINGVNGVADTPATDFDSHMGILIGDTNGNGTVNAADVAQTKGRLGQTVGAANFRSDVNANGSINAADTAIVKQNSGTSLPP